MSSTQEFRVFAKECLDWARTARSERERAIFLEMAQTWLAAAMRLEPALLDPVDNVEIGDAKAGDGAPARRAQNGAKNNSP